VVFSKVKFNFNDNISNLLIHDKPDINSQGKGFHKATEVTHLKPCFNVGDKWREANHIVKH